MHQREAEKLIKIIVITVKVRRRRFVIPEDLVHAATTANFANVGTRYERI